MKISDIKVIEKDFFRDHRGDLWTTWVPSDWNKDFNHDKVSISNKHVLRGLHGDKKSYKLVSCIYGEIFFAVVDLRKDSPTYLTHETFHLCGDKKQFILMPPGIANGFVVLSEVAIFNYKWSYSGKYPDVDEQFTLRWDDDRININWPVKEPILSERDKNAPLLDL
jgi:dTDP-4-dehydrorhamnose 3,5-epimerase